MPSEVPSGWSTKALERVATLQRGFDLPIQHRRGGPVPVYGSNGVDGWHDSAAVTGPGVITGRSGTIGFVFHEERDFWPLNTTLYVREFWGNEPKFITRLLQSMDLSRFAASTGVPSLNRNFVHPTLVSVPPPEEQRRICFVIDGIDDAIAKTERLVVKLRQVRDGLLADLLTLGLDENGRLRDPIAHPEQFQDSPSGRIPKAWKPKRLGLCSEPVTSGSRGWARYYSERGALFLRIANLTRDSIDLRLEDLVRVTPPLGMEGSRTRVQSGDVLISITADLGIIGVIPDQFEEAYVNQHIALVRIADGSCPRWIARYLASGPAATAFRRLNDAGAKAGMNLPAVESLLVAVPPLDEQVGVTQALDSIDARIREECLVLNKIEQLKSGLSADLLRGRVRVPESLLAAEVNA